jgi:hypothetical protein
MRASIKTPVMKKSTKRHVNRSIKTVLANRIVAKYVKREAPKSKMIPPQNYHLEGFFKITKYK